MGIVSVPPPASEIGDLIRRVIEFGLDHSSELIRLEAAEASRVEGLYSARSIDILVQLVVESRTPHVQQLAVSAIAKQPKALHSTLASTLISGLRSPASHTRAMCLEALYCFSALSDEHIKNVRSLASDDSEDVRRSAIRVLLRHAKGNANRP
jgi:hypothetical protein